jgi:hypothetical protein
LIIDNNDNYLDFQKNLTDEFGNSNSICLAKT